MNRTGPLDPDLMVRIREREGLTGSWLELSTKKVDRGGGGPVVDGESVPESLGDGGGADEVQKSEAM
jgi:hypothetical protein